MVCLPKGICTRSLPYNTTCFCFKGQVFPGDVDRESMGPAYLVEDIDGDLRIDDVAVRRAQAEGSFAQGSIFVGDQGRRDRCCVDLPQSLAMGRRPTGG